MAYQKTEKVRAGIEARKNLFIAAAIDIVSKEGHAGLTTNAVAAGSKLSVGLIYKYFADLTELTAALVQQQLDRDVAAIRAAAAAVPNSPLAAALGVYYARLKWPKLTHMLMGQPIYQIGIRNEIAKLIVVTPVGLLPKARTQAAIAALGALTALAAAEDGNKTSQLTATLFVLRGIGYGEATARRLVERV